MQLRLASNWRSSHGSPRSSGITGVLYHDQLQEESLELDLGAGVPRLFDGTIFILTFLYSNIIVSQDRPIYILFEKESVYVALACLEHIV